MYTLSLVLPERILIWEKSWKEKKKHRKLKQELKFRNLIQIVCCIVFKYMFLSMHYYLTRGHRVRDLMVVGCATTYPIRAYHHLSFEFEPHSWRDVLDTSLCDKVYQWLATGWWFYRGTLLSSTNKTDRHDITEIWLTVALNTIHQP